MSKRASIANAPLPVLTKVNAQATADDAMNAAVVTSPRKRPPRPIPEEMQSLRTYYTRHELPVVTRLCMSTIDNLEKRGVFPARIQLSPTRRVVWPKAEVHRFLEDRMRNRAKHGGQQALQEHQ